MEQITGTIKAAEIVDVGDYQIITGNIYDDIRKRWQNGTLILTSAIVGQDGDIYRTRNSIYRVELREK